MDMTREQMAELIAHSRQYQRRPDNLRDATGMDELEFRRQYTTTEGKVALVQLVVKETLCSTWNPELNRWENVREFPEELVVGEALYKDEHGPGGYKPL